MNIYEKFDQLKKLVGNTPFVEITFEYKSVIKKIYAKLEYYNYSGSIKDRIAVHILEQAYLSGQIKEGDIIAEATSGNTGISFCAIGRYLSHPITIFMPEWMSTERKNLMKSFGANLVLVSKEEGGFLKSISLAKEFANDNKNVFLPLQFDNLENNKAHELSTIKEIHEKLLQHSLTPTAFVAGVGTGGTVMGAYNYFKSANIDIKVHPLEPTNSPTLSTGICKASHRIQGISDEFIPSLLSLDSLSSIISVDDGDSIIMAQKLSKELGLGVGISSGANFLGALKVLLESDSDEIVTTIFADDNKKYLSTDLMRHQPVLDDYLSKNIKLISLKVL